MDAPVLTPWQSGSWLSLQVSWSCEFRLPPRIRKDHIRLFNNLRANDVLSRCGDGWCRGTSGQRTMLKDIG